jgi:hypothetical protein
METVKITEDLLRDYGQYLWGRGCYAPSTIRGMISGARRLSTLGIQNLPLDPDAAVDLVNRQSITRATADKLKHTTRALVEFCIAKGICA